LEAVSKFHELINNLFAVKGKRETLRRKLSAYVATEEFEGRLMLSYRVDDLKINNNK
jgi:hypothetical protein